MTAARAGSRLATPMTQISRRAASSILRMVPPVWCWSLMSRPLCFLFPLTGVVLLHAVDVPVLVRHGLPTRWLPPQFDQNRWKGPVRLLLRTLAFSPTDPDRLWIGHTYGLFASEDGGQHW